MAGIESQVLERFVASLRAESGVPDAVVEGLQVLFAAGKLPKAEQLAFLFAEHSGDRRA